MHQQRLRDADIRTQTWRDDVVRRSFFDTGTAEQQRTQFLGPERARGLERTGGCIVDRVELALSMM